MVVHLSAKGAIHRLEPRLITLTSPAWLLLRVTENAIRYPNRRHLRDLFQSLEKTRDAMSSSSVQADGEMSPEFAGLGTDSHMTKNWRGTVPWACRAQVQRGETGRAAELMSIPHPKFDDPLQVASELTSFQRYQYVIELCARSRPVTLFACTVQQHPTACRLQMES